MNPSERNPVQAPLRAAPGARSTAPRLARPASTVTDDRQAWSYAVMANGGATARRDGVGRPGPRPATPPSSPTTPATPTILRASMTPVPWTGRLARSSDRVATPPLPAPIPANDGAATEARWERAARHRRASLLAGVGISTAVATFLFSSMLPTASAGPAGWLRIALFAALFAWVAAGFFTAAMGFVALRHGDAHALPIPPEDGMPLPADARTAIVMPICNEHVATVFAGLRATCESLRDTDAGRVADVFVLSDTADPTLVATERAAWAALRAQLGHAVRLYYRHRQRRTRRKVGNIADFCRRWGRHYRYMVVLDADSVMSGATIVRLIRMMESQPRAGIIQTAPRSAGVDTLHARVQQFAGRLSGRLFAAGMRYWQLGESHYWGHNAILRVEPFIRHCALAPLPGRGGLSGDILSHDFVEAALMRRAGYEVWLAPELDGSYEQQPPDLVEELRRDRRWCQGNLMNLRLITEPGLRPVHRAMLTVAALSYVSAPMWAAFLLLGLFGGDVIRTGIGAPATLWLTMLAMLLLPRVFAVAANIGRGEQAEFGGSAALIGSAVVEALWSSLLAPVRMAAHTMFVLGALSGVSIAWRSPPREANALPVTGAARALAPIFLPLTAAMVAGGAWAAHVGNASVWWWLLPILGPLALSAPIAALGSRITAGRAWRAQGLLCTPEERHAPVTLRLARAYARRLTVVLRASPTAQDSQDR